MVEAISGNAATGRAPWHLWLVGGLALAWYALGAFTIQMAQSGKLPHIQADEIAYYAVKPVWLVIMTAVGTYGSVAGSLLLLLRRRAAVVLFAIALAGILLGNAAELLNGSSRAYANTGAAIVTTIVVVLAMAMLFYASAMRRRGVLR